MSNNNTSSSSSSSSNKTNWDPLLRHSSALGILKPGTVFNTYSSGSSSSSGSMSGPLGHGLSSSSSRLVRTGHKSDGTSSFISDEVVNPVYPFGPKASAFTIFDVRSAVPVTNTDPPVTPAGGVPRCPPNGATFVITEIPGGGFSSPMHRTLSIDYAVVLWGEIQVELDGGETKVLKKGDCLVQQGVNHKWVNNGTGKCKLLCVMLGANPVALPDGTVLGV